jgi:hypothetical protein
VTIITEYFELFDRDDPPALDATRRPSALSEADVNARLDAIGVALKATARPQHLRALALLWHDHLDASHQISQSLTDRDGSYLHALMHRREGDYSNAKYWFERVGAHPLFARLSLAEARPGQQPLAWDPYALVDAVQRAVADGTGRDQLIRRQRIELQQLSEWLCDGGR